MNLLTKNHLNKKIVSLQNLIKFSKLGMATSLGEGKTLNLKSEECCSKNVWHNGAPFFC